MYYILPLSEDSWYGLRTEVFQQHISQLVKASITLKLALRT